MSNCSIDGAEDTFAPVDTHITLEKVAVNLGTLSPPISDLAPVIAIRDSI